jgi:hypothetical protein
MQSPKSKKRNFYLPFSNVESIKIYIKNLLSIKNAAGKNSSLKDVWFARKKQKTVLNVAANAKT